MKRDFTSDFAEIKAMTNKIRRIDESINFEDDMGDEMYGVPEEEGHEEQMPTAKDSEDQEIESQVNDEHSPLNQIREICLKGMVALCHTPEDPEYAVLKKVFSMIDKANDKKPEEQG